MNADPPLAALPAPDERALRQLFEQAWKLPPLLTPAIGQLTLQALTQEGLSAASLNPWLMWFDRKKRQPLCLLQNITSDQITHLRVRHPVTTIEHPTHGKLHLLQGRGLLIPEHHYDAEQQRQNQTVPAAPDLHAFFRRTPPRPHQQTQTLLDLKRELDGEILPTDPALEPYFKHFHPAFAELLRTTSLLRTDHHLHVLATCRNQLATPLTEAADHTRTLLEQALEGSGWQVSVSPHSWDSDAYTVLLSGNRHTQSTWRWKRA